MFKLSENIDPNKVFIVNCSELEGRIDPEMVLYSMKNVDNFKYPCFQLKKMLLKSPQYGANEASVIRINNEQPRYIRITDIDENGTLNKELGATAETIDSKYILNNNDILFARSGATVGKTYIHKVKKINYKAFFAGYMIRFIVNPDIIIPDFLFIYTQLSVYKKWVKATQRAAGQPNINAEEYKSLKIPLPPLEIQQQIVDLYEKAYSEKQQKEAEAQRLLDSIDDYLLGELGIILPKEEEYLPQNTDKNSIYNLDNDNALVKKGRLFLTNLSEVTGKRWNSDYYKKYYSTFMQKIHNKYNSILLGEIVECIFQGIGKKEESYPNVKLLKVKNILKNNEIDYKSIDFLDKVPKDKILKIDDIITPFIGEAIKLIKFSNHTNNKDIYSIDNNTGVIRINKFNNPKYICEYLNSSIGAIQINRLIGGGGVPFMGGNNFKKILICLPPLEKQNEIASHITQIRSKANELKQEGKEILEQAKQEVEQMILGN